MRKLRLAFIGGGVNSAVGTTHKIASQMDERFELLAGCFGIEKEVNEQTAELWHVKRLYPSWRALLTGEKDRLDALTVVTPTSMHTEIVIEAIKLGYPVICEKALTASVTDALNIKEAVAKNDGYLAVTYNYTGYPMVRELRSMIKQGKLGKISQVHIEMPQEGFARLDSKGEPMTPQEWRLRDGEIPTISLDLGVHLHSIIYFLTGERPVEVIAAQNSFGLFKQVVDNVACLARYTNDVLCNVWYSKAALGHRNGLRVRVYGEKGSAEWFQMEPEILNINDNKGHSLTVDRGNVDVSITTQPRYGRFKAGHPAGFIEAFANLYNDIADSIIAHKERTKIPSEYVFGVDKALEGLYMMRAIARSAKSRAWEKVANEA
jgi:predicted dehydrogenase